MCGDGLYVPCMATVYDLLWDRHICICAGGMGIGMTVHRTLCHNLFLKDPHAAARHVWESSGWVSAPFC